MAGADIEEASEISFDSVYAELEKVINENKHETLVRALSAR